MSKQITFDMESRSKLKKGVDKLSNAVKVTLGPKGRNVVIGNKFGSPHITKDGVTVAKEITLEDPIENMGAQMVREAASNTNNEAGDGTSTATVLAQAIIYEGLKNVTAGANPMDIKKGIDLAVSKIVKHIKENSIKVGGDYSKIEQIATISSNNDSSIGALIATAMRRVKSEGVITVEEAKGIETTVELVEGMQFDRGYLSPHFVTNQEKSSVELEYPCILLYDGKISTLDALLPLLEKVSQTGKPLLIVAEDVDGEALSSLVMNKIRGALNVCAIKAPGFGQERKDILEDIAILTGGKVISKEVGLDLKSTELSDLGSSEKLIIDRDGTVIMNGNGEKSILNKRIDEIKSQIDNSSNDHESEKLQSRIAKLIGGVAVLYVGAPTEIEMKEKKDRVDDALAATRSAMEEGIVPGGGVALIRAAQSIYNDTYSEEESLGVSILLKAIEIPLRSILDNAGLDASVIIANIKDKSDNFGYDVKSEEYGDLIDKGIIDPAKVVRVSLENAASIASMLLTTECVINEITPEGNTSGLKFN